VLDIDGGKTHRHYSLFEQPLIAPGIALRGGAAIVRKAGNFNCQSRRGAVEIEDEMSSRVLAPEL